MKQVLVGTLHHGEQEYELCVSSLHRQRDVSFDHFMVAGLPNKEAHDTLYRRFMENASGYRYFLKLDADMVFRTDTALALMLSRISEASAGLFFMDVFDWPSQMPIPGIQLFRSDCRWLGSEDRLNVDHPPVTAGPLRRDTSADLVAHMPSSSKFQLFRYGVHKALKALQPDRREKSLAKGLVHAAILAGIARHWRASRDERLLIALVAAMLVFRGQAKDLLVDYAGARAQALYDALLADSARFSALAHEAEAFWDNEIQFFLGWHANMPKAYWVGP